LTYLLAILVRHSCESGDPVAVAGFRLALRLAGMTKLRGIVIPAEAEIQQSINQRYLLD
jgi:hypothetical protein